MFKGFLFLLIIGGLLWGAWWYRDNLNYVGSQDGTIVIEAREGIAMVGNDLLKAGLIKSPLVFKINFRLNDNNDLVAGTYSFRAGSTMQEIVDRLGRGDSDEVRSEAVE